MLVIVLLAVSPTVVPDEVTRASITEVLSNPEKYDGEYTGRRVMVTGTIKSLSPQNLAIEDEGKTLYLSQIGVSLFNGMNVGDRVAVIGVFHRQRVGHHYLDPKIVMYHPKVNVSGVSIEEIASSPTKYNGKFVSVVGNVTSVTKKYEVYRVYLSADSGAEVSSVKIRYSGGDPRIGEGDRVNVTGLYNAGVIHADSIEKVEEPMSIPGLTAATCLGVLLMFYWWFGRTE